MMAGAHRVLDPVDSSQIPPGLCALSIMTKAPRAGAVKTRLQPPLTPEEAASLNTCFLRDTAAAIMLACEGERPTPTDAQEAARIARGVGVYTPVGAEDAYKGILPPAFELIPQRGNTFGERLISAVEDLFQVGFGSVCLIDSDSPTVPEQAYAEAAEVLSTPGDKVVLGPSTDGGYYLIGMKRPHRRLFEEIDWSTARVLEQTLDRAAELSLEVHQLPTWYDVDDRATLHRLCDEVFGTGQTGGGFSAPETRRYLSALLEREGRDRIWVV